MALYRWSGVASGDMSLGSAHEEVGHDSFVRGIEDNVEVNTNNSQARGNVDNTAIGGLGSVKESNFVLVMASGLSYVRTDYAGAARSAI